jgi:hypothetical protein
MAAYERFVVLVPLLVTVVVVVVVDHGSTVRGGLVPFLGQAVGDVWHFLNKAAGFRARG